MGDVHHCSGPPVSEMTYTVLSGTLNSTIPYQKQYKKPSPILYSKWFWVRSLAITWRDLTSRMLYDCRLFAGPSNGHMIK